MKKLVLLLCVGLTKEIEVNTERILCNQPYISLNFILTVFFFFLRCTEQREGEQEKFNYFLNGTDSCVQV